MQDDRPTSSPTATETVRRDTHRILSEIAGGVDITDPFAAAVRATRMPMIITNRNARLPMQHRRRVVPVPAV